jgi:uncharacterized protein (DUF427 family)
MPAIVCGRQEEMAGLDMLRLRDWVTTGVRRLVMSTRPVLEPTAAHPITVEPTGEHVTVRVNGELVADTDNALTLQESTYPAVQYIPLSDVVADRLKRSGTETYCPYKGDASYYHVVSAAGDTVEDAIWTYEQPYPAVGKIAGHVAFYPEKAEIAVRRAGE